MKKEGNHELHEQGFYSTRVLVNKPVSVLLIQTCINKRIHETSDMKNKDIFIQGTTGSVIFLLAMISLILQVLEG